MAEDVCNALRRLYLVLDPWLFVVAEDVCNALRCLNRHGGLLNNYLHSQGRCQPVLKAIYVLGEP